MSNKHEYQWLVQELDINFTTEESENLIDPGMFNDVYINLPVELNQAMLRNDDGYTECKGFNSHEKPFLEALAKVPLLEKIDFSDASIFDACETSASICISLKADKTVTGYLVVCTPEKV